MNDLIGLAAYHDASLPEVKVNREEYAKHLAWEAQIAALGKIEVKHRPDEICDCHPEIQPFHCDGIVNSGAFNNIIDKINFTNIDPPELGISGYEAYLMAQEKKQIGDPGLIKDLTNQEFFELYRLAVCECCGHMKSMHVGRCKQMMEEDGRQFECRCNQMFSGGGQEYDPEKDGEPMEPGKAFIIKADAYCVCDHQKRDHVNAWPGCDVKDCHCRGWIRSRVNRNEPTKAEQSPSYLQSAQSEQPPPCEERQASFHFQCKDQHVRTVGDLLAHMASTLKSNPLAELETMREQLYPPLLALWKCEAIECQGVRTLAVLALSSLLLESESFRHTHTEPPNSV